MRSTHLPALALLTLGGLVMGCGGGGGGGGGGKASTVAPITSPVALRDLHSSDISGLITTPAAAGTQRAADTDAEYTALWNEHQQRGAVVQRPAVDFTQEQVVAVFLGERPSGGWAVEVVSVAEVASDTFELGYVVTRPTGAATGAVTNPCHFVAVNRVGPQVSFTYKDVTPAVSTTPVTDVHGELVLAPTKTGGQALAFLADGETTPREVNDPAALAAAGARVGSTLLVTGDVEANPLGTTALPEALRIVSQTVDDTATTGKLEALAGGSALRDGDGNLYEPIGPLATAVRALTPGRPLRVTGKVDPAHRSAIAGAVGLVVTSHRATTTIALRLQGGLAGVDRQLAVDDLPRTGAYRFHDSLRIRPLDARKGSGRMAEADRAALEGLVTAASLRTQPTLFRPQFPILDAPTTSLVLGDDQGERTITIQAGATVPASITALITALRAQEPKTATFRTLEKGTYSQVVQASARVARDAAALRALWTAHAGGGVGVTPPTVDFTTSLVVGVFQGRQPTGGYAIEVRTMDRRGDDLFITTRRTTPPPGTIVTQALTSPYHVVVIDHQGARGDVYVDGVKQ